MRFFLYYALHSIKNQIIKLFKSWVVVFILVCALIGGLIGVGAAAISEKVEAPEETLEEAYEEEESEETPMETAIEERSGLSVFTYELIELIGGVVILALIFMESIGADKNGSNIFLPADVSLLFSSPLKPQSVLLFRLVSQLGTVLLASIYLIFQVPNLVLNLHLSILGAAGILLAWMTTLFAAEGLRIFLYIAASRWPFVKAHLRHILYGMLLVILAVIFLQVRASSEPLLNAIESVMNASWTRFIPLWGWIKGFMMAGVENDPLMMILFFLLTAVLIGTLVFLTWRVKVDFYEDAMQQAEIKAAALEKARDEKNSATVVKRKKDRSDKLLRDGNMRGHGANVFFFKAMYNRYRFAHLHIFTKTSETYLFLAIGGILLFKLVFKTDGMIPILLAFAVLAFFRALGNPLDEDTRMDYFVMIPESTFSKLLYSLLGGTVNCLMDMLPGAILVLILYPSNIPVGLLLLLFAVTTDFYCTIVGTFIDLTVPRNSGNMIKQFIQILFIYFGLLPDIAIMAIGLITSHAVIAILMSMVVNLFLGGLFLIFTPYVIDPGTR